jgi:hypothetical protein
VEKIFGARLLRIAFLTRRDRVPARFYYVPESGNPRWKRVLALAPVLVGLFFVAVMDPGSLAVSKVLRTRIADALKDPLSLFGERSPGGRRLGALLSTKPPHERVLSTIREREPAPEIPPELGNPIFAAAPEALQSPPGEAPQPPAYGPPFSNTPFFFPGPPPPTGISTPPNTPPGTPPGTPPDTPPGTPPDTPPGTPPTTYPPGTIPIPEPASWLIVSLGFFAMGMAARRRRSN